MRILEINLAMSYFWISVLPTTIAVVWIYNLFGRANRCKIHNLLKNKTVLITGASGGLGEAFVRKIVSISESTNLILASRNNELLENLKEDVLHRMGIKCNISCYELDLCSPSSITNFCHRISLDHPNGVDILINNAGKIHVTNFITFTFFN